MFKTKIGLLCVCILYCSVILRFDIVNASALNITTQKNTTILNVGNVGVILPPTSIFTVTDIDKVAEGTSKINEDAGTTINGLAHMGDVMTLNSIGEDYQGATAYYYALNHYPLKVGGEKIPEFSNIDDMLNDIYPNDKKMVNKIKTVLQSGKSKYNENSFNHNGKYYVTTKLCKILSQIEVDGKVAYEINNVDIDSSKSMAVGEIYEPKDEDSAKEIVEYDDGPEELESALAGLISALGDGCNYLVTNCGASLDRLVYGRLIHYGTNYYCFELVKGNPYGIVGSYVYKLFRNIAVPFVLLMVLMRFAKAAWNSGGGEQRRIWSKFFCVTSMKKGGQIRPPFSSLRAMGAF